MEEVGLNGAGGGSEVALVLAIAEDSILLGCSLSEARSPMT